MTFDPSNRVDVQIAWNARQATAMRDYTAAHNRAVADASTGARLGVLADALRAMLTAQPDVWGGGFDPEQAAARLLPLLQSMVRE